MASTSDLRALKLFSFQNQVAVVTGGGTGIGLMAAQALAANGAKVYITSRRTEAIENAANAHHPSNENLGSIVPWGPCDVRNKEDLQKLAQDIRSKEGHINVLVAAAGVAGPRGSPDSEDAEQIRRNLWDNETVEDWNEVYDTNVTSVYFTVVAFLPLLQAAVEKFGHMSASAITISSMSGIMRHSQGHFSYNAAKGGTVQLTKLMSAEFQKAGVRVNSIAPGYFPSEMTTSKSGPDQKSHMPTEQVTDKGHVPAQRPGSDEEIAQAVLFLGKNQYVNGEILAVDGGVLNVVGGR